jgi:hypothetical protein
MMFAGSRYLLHHAGVAIHRLPLDGSWQLIDPELLQNELLLSVLYLHSQPPLYNLLVGALLQLCSDPAAAARAMDVLYAGLGLLLVLLMHRLMRHLGAGPGISLAAAALFSLSPAALLYENYAFYTHPAAVLLCLCAFLFHRTVSAFTPGRALALFAALAAMVYLRSLFQIAWFLALALLCAWALPKRRGTVALAALVPLLLVTALYAKNAAITGHFATSTWLGMSFAKLTTMQLAHPQRQAMVDAGALSPLALQAPFSAADAYPEYLASTPATGVAVLDRTRKSSGGINFNHAAYPAISRAYLKDAMVVLRRHPGVYLESLGVAHLMYFRPAADYPFLQHHRERIAPWVRGYNHAAAGQPVYVEEPTFELGGPGDVGYFVVAAFAVCVGFGGAAAWRCLRGQRGPIDAVLTFLWLNVLYVTVVGNALEMDENQRFRFLINPLLAVMLAVFITRAGAAWRRNARQRNAGQRPSLQGVPPPR